MILIIVIKLSFLPFFDNLAALDHVVFHLVLLHYSHRLLCCCCCCLPYNHCSSCTWDVQERLAYSDKRSMHCREFHCLNLCRLA